MQARCGNNSHGPARTCSRTDLHELLLARICTDFNSHGSARTWSRTDFNSHGF